MACGVHSLLKVVEYHGHDSVVQQANLPALIFCNDWNSSALRSSPHLEVDGQR